MQENLLIQLAIALLLGLLVGLQRERTEPAVAGIRTFPLITMLGTICGALASAYNGWIIAAGLVGITVLFVIANLARMKKGDNDPGLTTEMAALVMYGVGAYLTVGSMGVAVVVGGAVAILLHAKRPMHKFVAAMGETDIKAIMQFVLITLVILPVLPNQPYGPYEVLNPFKVWLMVVLIVGMGLCGYVAYKVLGEKAGTLLGGLLGGLISSTATTVSYSRRTAKVSSSVGMATTVIALASTVVFGRVLVEIAAVAPGNFVSLALPLSAMLLVFGVISGVVYMKGRHESADMPEQSNPAQLKSALVFGALYAVVIFAVAAAKDHFGSSGLYTVAVLSGLTDMDAITLSTAQLVNEDRLPSDTGWRTILVASMSNLVFKGGIVAVLGDRELLKRIAFIFLLAFVAGGLILWLWPAVPTES